MNELQVIDSSKDIVVSGFLLHKNGITPQGNPTFNQWLGCGEFIKKANGAVHWWIGDWLNHGETHYGEMYSQALDETEFDYGTLRNDRYIADKVDLSRRRDSLSFAHHQEVAPLDPKIQEKLLDVAEREGLTRQELRVYIKELKLDGKRDDIDDRPIVPYGDNIFYLTAKWQKRNSDFIYVKDGEMLPTLKRRSWFYHNDTKREFTLREYAQVQEFPDDFKFVGTYEKIKDQIGNAVAPTMAKHVGEKIKGNTIGDLFAGCGGLTCGLEMLGKKSLWAIERSVYYARTYKVNFPHTRVMTRDIKKLNPKSFEKVDVIVGGPPCQGFSLSGIRFKDDPRNELYKEFLRFVKELKPKEFLMENVPQIEMLKEQITHDFKEIGYKVEGFLVKGEDIGMRQKRHRYFYYGNNN